MDEVNVVKFSVEDAIRIGGIELADAARLNQISGPAYSAFLNDKLVACGGVRIVGVGEAWALYSPEALKHKIKLLKHSRIWLDNMTRNESLWRIWSECPEPKPNQNFLEHMNFNEVKAYLRG